MRPSNASANYVRFVDGFRAEQRVEARTKALSREVEERKQTEEALRKSESYLAEAQGTANIGNWWLNIKTGELYWSDEIYRIFGRNPSEFEPSYERFYETVHPDDVAAVKKLEKEAFSKGENHSVDHRIELPDGSIRWVHEEAVSTLGGEDELTHLAGTVQDITERKLAEEALLESEHRFRDFAEAASDWFWEMDENLCFTYHSQRYFMITGFSPEEKKGTTRTRYVDTSDLERDAYIWASHLEDLGARRPFKNFEFTFRRKDGASITANISGTPIFDADGVFLGYRGTGTDITDRKRTENLLQDAFDSIDEGFSLWDSDNRFVMCNKTYCESMLDVVDLLKPGTKIKDLFRAVAERGLRKDAIGNEEEWVRKALKRFRKAGKPFETELNDGFWVETHRFKTRDDSTIRIDITKHKRDEDTLRQMHKMEAVGQLTGCIAHDFNNLLHVIVGNLEMLDEDLSGDADAQKMVRTAKGAAFRDSDLTQKLLAFSREQSLSPEILNANALITEAVEILGRTLGERTVIKTAF